MSKNIVGVGTIISWKEKHVSRSLMILWDDQLPSVFLVLFISNGVIGAVGIRYALAESPFWEPVIFIPVLGMLLGNTMSSVAMSISTCIEGIMYVNYPMTCIENESHLIHIH